MIRAALLLLGASFCASAAMAGGKSAQTAVNCTPLGELRGDAERGAILHHEHCADCHGERGRAATGMKHMDVPPRDQGDARYMQTLPDEFLYLAICRGGKAVGRNATMPAWGNTLSDQDIKDLIAWIRSFPET